LRAKDGFKNLIVANRFAEGDGAFQLCRSQAETLKGMKFARSGPWAKVMEEYFGACRPSSSREIYTLLPRKGVD